MREPGICLALQQAQAEIHEDGEERDPNHIGNDHVHGEVTADEEDPVAETAIGGENLTDKRYLLSGNNNPGVGVISGTYSTPRMWFAGVKIRSR